MYALLNVQGTKRKPLRNLADDSFYGDHLTGAWCFKEKKTLTNKCGSAPNAIMGLNEGILNVKREFWMKGGGRRQCKKNIFRKK